MANKTHYIVKDTIANLVGNPLNKNMISSDDTQLLFGEGFTSLKDEGNFIYGTSVIDGYKGYIRKDSLIESNDKPSHFVDALATHIYPEPSFKIQPKLILSFLSRLTIDPNLETEGFLKIINKGWVYKNHIKPIDDLKLVNPVNTALKFLGIPYLYGGRSFYGLDCSALIQLALIRNGMKDCSRDSKDQQQQLGTAISKADIESGDLVFFPGHVGIMVDNTNLLNATARQMSVVIEPLADVIKAYNKITAIKRLSHALT